MHTCNEVIIILQRGSSVTREERIRAMAVTRVSMADTKSPAAASDTAREIALLDTVRLRFIISSNSAFGMEDSTVDVTEDGGAETDDEERGVGVYSEWAKTCGFT